MDLADALERIVALIARSVELRLQQRFDAALACLDQAVAIAPRLPLAQINRAQLLAELRRYAEALDGYDAFLCCTPSPEIAEARQDLLDAAFADLDQRLAEWPDDLAARLERANLLRQTRRYDEAIADYAAIVACDAQHADALNHLATTLLASGRLGEAIDAYARAVAAAPQRAELHYNLGNALQQQGSFGEARAAYRQAIALSPDFAEAQLEIAHCALAAGDFSAGWPAYEWRWRAAQMRELRLPSESPQWLGGATALTAKTILVWAEQGAGDTLQFVRLVPRLLALADRVILRVQAPLRRLVESLDARVEVVGDDQPLPAHDVQVPLLSLPLALGLDAVPPFPAPYLRADRHAVARWRERLGAQQRRRVGIVWAGRSSGLANASRDIAPELLAPLAALPVELISLQLPAAEVPALPRLRAFADELSDFAESAALIETLDLVLCVDTAVAHLAGALGKPCWLLLRASGEWRWQRERSDCPWYPSLTIYRQSAPGDWAGVIARVAAALGEMVEVGHGVPNLRPERAL